MSVYINSNYKSPDSLSILDLVANKSVGFGIAPVGTIFPYYGEENPNPQSLLICDGREFDIEQFEELYNLLKTNKTPDLREITLVGAGENATLEIKNHTNYSVGDFEDDQIAVSSFSHTHDISHTHTINNGMVVYTSNGTGSHMETTAAAMRYYPSTVRTDSISTTTSGEASLNLDGNIGDTTHGKQVAVIYLIVGKQASLDEFDFPIDTSLQLNSEFPVQNKVIAEAMSRDFAIKESLDAIKSDPTISLSGKYAYAADSKYVYKYENNEWVLTDIKLGGAGIFYGTKSQWDALTNKEDYEYASLSDTGDVIDNPIFDMDISNFGAKYESNHISGWGSGWGRDAKLTMANVPDGYYLLGCNSSSSYDNTSLICSPTAVSVGKFVLSDSYNIATFAGGTTAHVGSISGAYVKKTGQLDTITWTVDGFSSRSGSNQSHWITLIRLF